MTWHVFVTAFAQKNLLRFPKKDRIRIALAVSEMENNPYVGDVQKIGGDENIWRRRVGAYRILYELIAREHIIYIYKIERRSSRTY